MQAVYLSIVEPWVYPLPTLLSLCRHVMTLVNVVPQGPRTSSSPQDVSDGYINYSLVSDRHGLSETDNWWVLTILLSFLHLYYINITSLALQRTQSLAVRTPLHTAHSHINCDTPHSGWRQEYLLKSLYILEHISYFPILFSLLGELLTLKLTSADTEFLILHTPILIFSCKSHAWTCCSVHNTL